MLLSFHLVYIISEYSYPKLRPDIDEFIKSSDRLKADGPGSEGVKPLEQR